MSYSLPTIALQIAAKFFHLKCYINHDRFIILASCLLLATKLKDMDMKLKNLCFAFHSIMSRLTQSSTPVDENRIKTISEQIMIAESEVLRTLEYNIDCTSPHEYVKKYCV